jgi:hypothetical protein
VPPIPGLAVAALVVIAVAVLAVGEPVRRWNSGDRSRRLDPLRAARTVVLAQASALAGAALAGWYAGQAVLVVGELAIEPRRDRFVAALLATGGALAMVAAGLVVQRWCRLPPEDDDDTRPAPSGRPDTDQGSDGREKGHGNGGPNGRGSTNG